MENGFRQSPAYDKNAYAQGGPYIVSNQLDSTKNQTLGYDALSRLTGFTGAWGSGSFGYDALGNRTSKTVAGSTTSYAYSGNRLSSTSGGEAASYSYNGIGALSGGTWQGGTYSLAYDPFSNLQTYSLGSTALAGFGYDGDGMRVTKAANGKTVVYHYDQAGNTITETEANGNYIADYILLNGKLVAKLVATPVITITPSSDSFGITYVNTASSYHVFTVKNTGTAGLVLGTASLTGANATEFVKPTDGCSGQTLASNASCTVQISFAPLSTGARTANLAIPSNDPVTPILNIPLNGIGVLPTLTISKNGTGTGTVTSSTGGISCGGVCSASYMTGTAVTLTATPAVTSSFAGWSGACSGTGACAVTMSGDKAVTATFNVLPPVAAFSATPTSGGSPYLVNFTDQSQRATSWLWNFGDGTTSAAQSPSHLYRLPGTYSVTLTSTNAGGTATITKSNYITAGTCSNTPFRILGKSGYSTLQAAYDSAVEGDVIQSLAQDFTMSLAANRSISVTIDGGYLCNFSSNPNITTLKGAPTVNNGTVNMKNIYITQ